MNLASSDHSPHLHHTHPVVRHSPECSPEDMRSLVSDSFCPMDYQTLPSSMSATSRLTGVGLGAIDVFRHDGIGKRLAIRSAAHIRQHWVDDFMISLPLNARVKTRQAGHLAELDSDSFVILSTTKPFDAAFAPNDSSAVSSTFLIRINGPVLRQRVPALDRYCGMPLTIGAGAGRIMRGMFQLALEEGASLSNPLQIERLGNALLDTIANVAVELPSQPGSGDLCKTAYERIRAQAMPYIHSQLSNPDLSVGQVAQHCRVSTRYLQTAFAADSLSVIGYIRESRLQQCRAALQNADVRDMSVIDIAMRWGFNDAPYFSRAYKARFGRSPGMDRG